MNETGRLRFRIPVEKQRDMINNSRTLFDFKFNGLLGMDATQEDVFASVAAPCVKMY